MTPRTIKNVTMKLFNAVLTVTKKNQTFEFRTLSALVSTDQVANKTSVNGPMSIYSIHDYIYIPTHTRKS